jgi:uncharacterized protein (DUF885 family)
MTRLIVISIFFSSFSTSSYAQDVGSFNAMLNSYYQEYLALNPTTASSVGDYRYNDRLENPITVEYRENHRRLYTRYLDSLKVYADNKLTAREKLSKKIFRFDINNRLKLLKYPSHLTPINQFRDMRLQFSQLGAGSGDHPFKTVRDYHNFLNRINDFEAYVDTAIANMRMGMKVGRVQPRAIMEKVIPQLKSMIVKDATTSLFYTPVKNMPTDFSEEDRQGFTTAYKSAITNKLVPLYTKLLNFIETEYMPATRSTVGMLYLPNGKEQYAQQVRYFTTTNMSPDAIFNIGLSEVKRIHGEMDKIQKEVGFKGTRNEFFKYLLTDQKFLPFKEEADVTKAYYEIHERMKPHLTRLFNMTPKTRFEIRPVEKYRAATSAAHYNRGTPDGSRPGIFYFPVVDPKKYAYWRMEDLFLHEAIPGHHYQISLQVENPEIPSVQKIGQFGAYVEGWALYTEKLGKELGLYTDPYQRLGQLQGEIHRAIRLVVDVGMHHKGWTREQAIKYSLDNEAVSEASATQEIERYIVYTGQALSYKIGEMKIIEVRKKAEKMLGKKFDVKAFHDEVLKDGAMPLQVFEEKMNEWMRKEVKRR